MSLAECVGKNYTYRLVTVENSQKLEDDRNAVAEASSKAASAPKKPTVVSQDDLVPSNRTKRRAFDVTITAVKRRATILEILEKEKVILASRLRALMEKLDAKTLERSIDALEKEGQLKVLSVK
jgi:hypothetical protein